MMMMKSEVVIIGGGINGCALAYELSLRDVSVILVEKKYLTYGATGRCGAGIRQQWSTRENVELAMDSVKIFEELQHGNQWDIGLRQGGYLIVIHDEEELGQMKKNVQMQQSLGLDVSLVEKDQIPQIVPSLDPSGMDAMGATFCPSDGHADPFKTTYAYAHAARAQGAQLYTQTEVTDIRSQNGEIQKVKTTRGSIKTGIVINAAGAWSQRIASMLDVAVPNVPFRKEILVTERLQPLFEAMVISFRDGIYFSQMEGGQIVGGIPIPHEQPGYLMEPTFTFLQHMSRTLTRYMPCLKHLNVLRQWTGFYDVTPDALPILGETPGLNRFIQCHGFSGHGFMVAPMIARLLSQLIIEEKSCPILDRLGLHRFKDKDWKVQERSVVG